MNIWAVIERGGFGALKSDSIHHFFRNAPKVYDVDSHQWWTIVDMKMSESVHGSSVLVIDKVDHHYIAVISLKLACN
jgi:hypothetical protein